MNNMLLRLLVLCMEINNNFPVGIDIYAPIAFSQLKVVFLLIDSISIIPIFDIQMLLIFQNQHSRTSIH